MNLAKLKTNVGIRVQLIPVACYLDEFGRALPEKDEDWIVLQVADDHILIQGANGHQLKLGPDHIHHYTSNPERSQGGMECAFLSLHVQVFIQGVNAWVKPNLRPGEPMPPPVVHIEDKAVHIEYPTDSGLQRRLEAQGYRVHWCAEPDLVRRTEIDGWEIVFDRDANGVLCRFRVKDRIHDLILLRKRG